VFSYQSMTVSGNQVVLQFNRALDASQLPTVDDFRLTWQDNHHSSNGIYSQELSVSKVAVSATDPTALVLTLAQPVTRSGTVQLAYTDHNSYGLDEHHVASTDGATLASFTGSKAVAVAPPITSIT
jgi:hypothetical protein